MKENRKAASKAKAPGPGHQKMETGTNSSADSTEGAGGALALLYKQKQRLRDAWLEANKPPEQSLEELLSDAAEPFYLQALVKVREEAQLRRMHQIVWQAIKDNLELAPDLKKTWKDYAPQILCEGASDHLANLKHLAETGDIRALEALAAVSIKLVSEINILAQRYHQQLESFAAQQTCWPMLIGRRKSLGDDTDQLIRLLHVERDSIHGKDSAMRATSRSRFGRVLADLLARIENVRAKSAELFLIESLFLNPKSHSSCWKPWPPAKGRFPSGCEHPSSGRNTSPA